MKRSALALIGLGLVVLPLTALAGNWRNDRADQDASAMGPGSGDITGVGAGLPTIAYTIENEGTSIPDLALHDVDDDGLPEVLMVYEGRVAAFDVFNGTFRWVSPSRAVTSLLPLVDIDSDGDVDVAATSASVDGGLFTFAGDSGAVLGGFDSLPEHAGVAADEVAVFDANGDDTLEFVFPSSIIGVEQVWSVSFPDGLVMPQVAAVEFEGYSNLTPVHGGRFFEGEAGFVLDQGPNQTLYRVCSADDVLAACTPDESLCWCPAGVLEGLHESYVFGRSHVVDVDGDEIDEIITVATHPSHGNLISVLDVAEAVAGDDPLAGLSWYRNYGGAKETFTHVVTPAETPQDLNGDGSTDLIVSFFNNQDDDVDRSGEPDDDGIDAPNAISTGIFDASTGKTEGAVVGEFAFGTVDLDGDGSRELVTGPADGWTFELGLRGWELECGGNDCNLVEAWSAPGYSLARNPDALSGSGVPIGPRWVRSGVEEAEVFALDVDDDPELELLAYGSDTLEILDVVDGSLVSLASAAIDEDEAVRDVDPETMTILVVGDDEVTVYDTELKPISSSQPFPRQGWAPWRAGAADGGSIVGYESRVFAGGLESEPERFLPSVVSLEDLDGDGNLEVLSRSTPADGLGPGYQLQLDEFDPDLQAFELQWSLGSFGHPQLDGSVQFAPLYFASGQFVGDESEDLAFPIVRSGAHQMVFVDGATGLVEEAYTVSRPSTSSPLLVADVVDSDGEPGADGVDDVVVSGTQQTFIITSDGGQVAQTGNLHYHFVGANGDVDGDGSKDVVATLSTTSSNTMEAISVDGSLASLWGPVELGSATGLTRVLALADIAGGEALEILYITAEGSLEGRSGSDGSMLAGYPIYLSGGQVSAQPADVMDVPTVVVAADVDGADGTEVLVGTREGWLYAMAGESKLWAVQLGAAVADLAFSDVDNDDIDEVLVSLQDGTGVVLEGGEASLEILVPGEDDCIANVDDVVVVGTASGIVTVDLEVNAVPGTQDVLVDNGDWQGSVSLGGPGEYEIKATGFDADDQLLAIATRTVQSDGESDGDGVTICGGDCDDGDATRYPGATEICGDGIDQDCDGQDLPCDGEEAGDGGDDGGLDAGGDESGGDGSEVGIGDDDGGSGCNCDVDQGRRAGLGMLLIPMLSLARRRRRRV